MHITFDTKQTYRDLSEGNLFSKEQADRLTDTLRNVVARNAEDLATKDDLKLLEVALRAEIDQLRSEFKSDMKIMQQQLTIRLGGIMVVGIGVLTALMQVFG